MSDMNSTHNRIVWADIPASNLARAAAFYAAILNKDVPTDSFKGADFAIIDHDQGNGGCIMVVPGDVSDKGITVYFNADGRIKDALAKAQAHGGKVLQPIHSLGPHGFRAVLLDSEGNRIAIHSNTDA